MALDTMNTNSGLGISTPKPRKARPGKNERKAQREADQVPSASPRVDDNFDDIQPQPGAFQPVFNASQKFDGSECAFITPPDTVAEILNSSVVDLELAQEYAGFLRKTGEDSRSFRAAVGSSFLLGLSQHIVSSRVMAGDVLGPLSSILEHKVMVPKTLAMIAEKVGDFKNSGIWFKHFAIRDTVRTFASMASRLQHGQSLEHVLRYGWTPTSPGDLRFKFLVCQRFRLWVLGLTGKLFDLQPDDFFNRKPTNIEEVIVELMRVPGFSPVVEETVYTLFNPFSSSNEFVDVYNSTRLKNALRLIRIGDGPKASLLTYEHVKFVHDVEEEFARAAGSLNYRSAFMETYLQCRVVRPSEGDPHQALRSTVTSGGWYLYTSSSLYIWPCDQLLQMRFQGLLDASFPATGKELRDGKAMLSRISSIDDWFRFD